MMSKSLTDKKSTNGNDTSSKEFNEFSRIQGLEPYILRWLQEAFQVFTVSDLANLSVNRVFFQAAGEGKPISRDQVEQWITQAQTFAAEQTSWQTFATFVVSLQSRQVGGQTEQRTIAYFVEADRRKIWSGSECNGVHKLMLDQLKNSFQLESEVTIPIESELKIEPESIGEIKSESEASSQFEGAAQEPETEIEQEMQPEPMAGIKSKSEPASQLE